MPCLLKGTLLEGWLRSASGHAVRIQSPSRGDRHQVLEMALRSARAIWEERKQENLESRQRLKSVAEALKLEILPERIECFDISHLAGTETVASMVVFTKASRIKRPTGILKFRQEQNDDFASAPGSHRPPGQQALQGSSRFFALARPVSGRRRLWPGQSVARQLADLGVEIPLISIAKKQEELFRPGIPSSLVLDRRHEGLKLVQRIRDEAHRFAIEYNRLRRRKRTLASELDAVPGIGPRRKQELLKFFGSVKRMRLASADELAAAPGMNVPAARQLFEWLNKPGAKSEG